VFLDCEPAEEPEVRRQLPGVPRLDHLEVPGPFQGRGIGTGLFGAAEDTACQLGYERIALGVGLDNPQGSGGCMGGRVMSTGPGDRGGELGGYPDDGPPVTLSEVCDMLVKRL
jgi:GNAT superfamily N-acetyltransferase